MPVPGIDLGQVKQLQEQAKQGGVLSFLQLFSGGALTQFAVFALGIMPYITSSIIMQILTVVIPKLEQWQQQGAVGQRKITQWTRYLTIAIALGAVVRPVVPVPQRRRRIRPGAATPRDSTCSAATRTSTCRASASSCSRSSPALRCSCGWASSSPQRGIGNGMSLLIFASVVSTIPAAGGQIEAEKGLGWLIVLIGVGIAILVGIVFVEQGQRRIPVQFAKRVVGRRMYGGQSHVHPA